MSELIHNHDNRATIRWKLLTGASALALTAYICVAPSAGAADTDKPTIWIELGGQMEMMQGISSPFTAPFMNAITPTPEPYRGDAFDQKPLRYAMGLDGKISFQPDNSDWIFSAGIRYGRSHTNRHIHHQSAVPTTTQNICLYSTYCLTYTNHFAANKVADNQTKHQERHAILDFQAGKDIGLGMFGNAKSNLSAGVRIAQFSIKSAVDLYGRPDIGRVFPTYFHLIAVPTFAEYFQDAKADRSFTGAGPSISWSGSAPIAGNTSDGELQIDWGLNAALLFGKQKAKTYHETHAYNLVTRPGGYYPRYGAFYTRTPKHSTRSRSVSVPNVGGFVGLSYRYIDAKISIGYRYDAFINAMDIGIDTAKKSTVTFNGPYASISIGIGD